eukprot:2819658-Pyramimonas_sp.AAC.1
MTHSCWYQINETLTSDDPKREGGGRRHEEGTGQNYARMRNLRCPRRNATRYQAHAAAQPTAPTMQAQCAR